MNLASGRFRPAELAAVLALHAGALWAVGNQTAAPLPEPVAPAILVASLIAAPVSAVAPAPAPAPRPVEPRPEPVKPRPTPVVPPRPSPVLAVESPAPAQVAAPSHVEAPPSPPVAAPAPPAPAVVASNNAAAAVAAAPSPAQPRTVSSGISYLRPPAPEYPGLSRRRGESGVVELRVLVDAGGIPQRAEVARSSGHERLDNAAIAAAMKALFKPHVVDGSAVPIWALISTRFDLDS